MTQTLLPRADGKGRVLAMEILIPNPAIRNLIREAKTHQIYTQIEAGGALGMQTMDRAIAELLKRGRISREVAFLHARKPEELRRHVSMV